MLCEPVNIDVLVYKLDGKLLVYFCVLNEYVQTDSEFDTCEKKEVWYGNQSMLLFLVYKHDEKIYLSTAYFKR